MWDPNGLITPVGTEPTLYLGLGGNSGNKKIGGKGDAIVEDMGGPGTARNHWSKVVYNEELMTGWIESNGVVKPLSELTVASLTDLGFEVDLKKADPFSLLKPAKTRKHRRGRFQRRNTHQRIQFINDVQHYPYEEVKNVIPKPGREAEYLRDKQNYHHKRKLRLEKKNSRSSNQQANHEHL